MSNINEFIDKLVYLGGNIGINNQKYKNEYLDLEKFVVDATLFLQIDSRLTRCFIHWIMRYGIILSPSKLRRILKITKYDPYVLTVIISYIENHNQNIQNWEIIKPYCKRKNKSEVLFKNIPLNTKKYNIHFLKANLLTKKIRDEESKYLKTKSYILNNCVEIYYRSKGFPQVVSDLKAYIKKVKFKSLYEIAKYTYNERTRINQSYNSLNFLETL